MSAFKIPPSVKGKLGAAVYGVIGYERIERAKTSYALIKVGGLRYLRHQPFKFNDSYDITLIWGHDFLSRDLIRQGHHFDDQGLLLFARQVLRQGMTVFDIGAQYGAFTIFVAKQVGQRGIVHCFEPTKHSYQQIRNNLCANDLDSTVNLNCCAVHSYSGEIAFNLFAPTCSAFNTTIPNPKMSVLPVSNTKVTCVSLDDYCMRNAIKHIDLLKIDVEGAEIDVLKGSKGMISENKIQYIVFEISQEPLRATNYKPYDVIRAFSTHGRRVYLIASDGTLSPINTKATTPLPNFANYVSVRDADDVQGVNE